MTRIDFGKERRAIVRKQMTQCDYLKTDRGMEEWLKHIGYPTYPGLWRRFISSGIPSKCFICALCKVFECNINELVQPYRWEILPDCTRRAEHVCHKEGDSY